MVKKNHALKKSMEFENFTRKINKKKGILGVDAENPQVTTINN